jgi:glycosyltransferase involved in cell wall biosynthesis
VTAEARPPRVPGVESGPVVIVAEQLRRPVGGGIATFATALLGALAELAAGNAEPPLPPISLCASRPLRLPDPLGEFGFPVHASLLPGPVLTRAWSAGLIGPHAHRRARRPGRATPLIVHSVSTAAPPPRGSVLVVTVHDVAWRAFPDAVPRHGRRWHEAALQRALRRAARLVVPSQAVRTELIDDGAAESSIVVVGEGSDHLPPPDNEGTRRLLARLGVHGPFLLAVGTLEPRKNLDRLLEAYAGARSKLPEPWPLVVVGPVGWGPKLSAAPGVVAAGRVSGPVLVGLYRQARLVAYVPLAEGFGLPPVEAMRVGTPVVASPVPSVAVAPAPAVAAVIDPRQADDIAAALVSVASDDELRRRLVAAGRAHAEEMTWEAVARRHVALWGELR